MLGGDAPFIPIRTEVVSEIIHISVLWVWLRDPASINKVKEQWRMVLTIHTYANMHIHMCVPECACTHGGEWIWDLCLGCAHRVLLVPHCVGKELLPGIDLGSPLYLGWRDFITKVTLLCPLLCPLRTKNWRPSKLASQNSGFCSLLFLPKPEKVLEIMWLAGTLGFVCGI